MRIPQRTFFLGLHPSFSFPHSLLALVSIFLKHRISRCQVGNRSDSDNFWVHCLLFFFFTYYISFLAQVESQCTLSALSASFRAQIRVVQPLQSVLNDLKHCNSYACNPLHFKPPLLLLCFVYYIPNRKTL